MSKVAVVYWTGTGNTGEMAYLVAEGARGAGAQVSVILASDFTPEIAREYDALALGCPSMGVESLEEDVFRPMWDSVKTEIREKKVALFGSYDWGEGEWMRNWEYECEQLGIPLYTHSIICVASPDEEKADLLRQMGASLA